MRASQSRGFFLFPRGLGSREEFCEEVIGLQLGIHQKDELPPVFDMQSRYAREFFGVARDQGGPQAQRLGGNEGVQGANRRTCIFQNRAHSSIYLRHCVVYWKDIKGCEDG